MSRIELSDNSIDSIVKMSDGNPGAATALADIFKETQSIDPQSAMGGIGPILFLDTLEIYGTDIYILFDDKCQRDVRKMIMILRATQLGLFSDQKLKEMAADQTRQVDISQKEWDDIDDKVCERLVDFKKREV